MRDLTIAIKESGFSEALSSDIPDYNWISLHGSTYLKEYGVLSNYKDEIPEKYLVVTVENFSRGNVSGWIRLDDYKEGASDCSAGLIFSFIDKNNYYGATFISKKHKLEVFRVKNGKRTAIKHKELKAESDIIPFEIRLKEQKILINGNQKVIEFNEYAPNGGLGMYADNTAIGWGGLVYE